MSFFRYIINQKRKIFRGYRLNMAKYARPRSLSGTADRSCEVCFRSKTEGSIFRHIQSITLFYIFHQRIHILKTFLLSSKTFEMFNIFWDSSKFVLKRSRRDFDESKHQANIAGKRCLYTGIKRPLMAIANAVHALFLAVVSMYLHQFRHLYVFGTIQCF